MSVLCGRWMACAYYLLPCWLLWSSIRNSQVWYRVLRIRIVVRCFRDCFGSLLFHYLSWRTSLEFLVEIISIVEYRHFLETVIVDVDFCRLRLLCEFAVKLLLSLKGLTRQYLSSLAQTISVPLTLILVTCDVLLFCGRGGGGADLVFQRKFVSDTLVVCVYDGVWRGSH